jgi:ribosomal protein L1
MSKSRLETALVAEAVTALFDYEDKKIREKGKRATAKPILAQVQLKASVKKTVVRPVRVKLPHSLVTDEEDEYSVCLFCKNEEKTSIDAYLSKNPVTGLTKLLSVADVKKHFSASKDKKLLLGEFSHFICDTSVLSQLHQLLGKAFAERTNCPIPVSFTSPEKIHDAMMKVLSSSYMHLKGKIISIRLGLTSMSEEEVTANTLEGLEFAIAKFRDTWKDVHSIHLKTADSPSLPIYSQLPSEVLEYVKLKANIPVEQKPLRRSKSNRRRINSKDATDSVSTETDPKTRTDNNNISRKRDRMTESEIAALVVVHDNRPKGIKRIKSCVLKR